jgi:hypothetical protein
MKQNSQNWSYDTLYTPKNDKDSKNFGEKVLKEMLTMINSNGWEVFSRTDKVLLEETSVKDSNISAVKGTIVFTNKNKSFEYFVNSLYSSLFVEKKKIYDELISNKAIRIIDENNVIVHSQFAAPSGIIAGLIPIAPREFVVLKSRQVLEDGSYLITAHSINYYLIPFSKGFVRGVVKTGMLITQLGDNKIRVIKVDHLDPKGWIPSAVINFIKAKSRFRLIGMMTYLK